MEKCSECGSKVKPTTATETITIDGRKFTGDVAGWECKAHGVFLDGEAWHRFDLAVAATLAREGASSGEALRHRRKALGLPFGELAALLGVAPDTLVRWERGEREAPRATAATIGALALDAAGGTTATADRLRALRGERPKLAKVVRVEVPPAAVGR
jgi:DNA-binding transcriptional regulator YiaG